jgi:hypothetical protein
MQVNIIETSRVSGLPQRQDDDRHTTATRFFSQPLKLMTQLPISWKHFGAFTRPVAPLTIPHKNRANLQSKRRWSILSKWSEKHNLLSFPFHPLQMNTSFVRILLLAANHVKTFTLKETLIDHSFLCGHYTALVFYIGLTVKTPDFVQYAYRSVIVFT